MGVPCPHCAFRNPHSATACGGCGRSLHSAEPTTAERRQLTVFFADIVGSASLAETLDPEDLRELYARYQSLCAEIVQRYEGHLAQYLGDGVLAYFGYPVAHEDDASRAVRTGLDILENIRAIQVAGNRPQARIGIHTGLVVVGDVGAGLRREQLALGEAPNIAARLQSEAAPGTLVISDATARLVAGQFAMTDLGSRTLKGISRPMKLFQVTGKSGAKSRFDARTALTGLTRLVGREREVRSIREAWEAAVEGRGQTVMLRGEAGIGKSRLLAAAGEIASASLHEVFDAECSPYLTNTPLHPIVEMLERRLGSEKDQLDLIEHFAAGRGVNLEDAASAIAGLLSIPTQGRYREIEMPPARRRQWTIEILSDLLLHAVDRSPVLLRIEDLHWADASTLDLLDQILGRQANLPVLIVCTARPGFTARWATHEHFREIDVEPLPPEDTRALVAGVVGPKPLPPLLMKELVARTAGIPLFVEAVTRTVIEAGILREMDDRYELIGTLPPGLIPATVQDSLMARIDRLGPLRSIAQLAATIGREFQVELLQAVLGKPPEELAEGLKRMVDLDLVAESGATSYTFKHALIQDAAYESLLRKTRQEFHGKIAEALLGRFPEMAETRPEVLARHYEGAGRVAEAARGWMNAAAQTQQRVALRESIAYLQKAVDLLETLPADDPDRLRSELEAQLALSRTLRPMLGWGSREVEAASIRARDLCERLGNQEGLLSVLMGLSSIYFLRGNMGESSKAAKSALEMVLPLGDPIFEIIARHGSGYTAYFMADFACAREHAEKALAYYTPERERQLVVAAQSPSSFACANFLALSLWSMGYPEQAEQAHRKSWAIIEALDIPACTAFGLASTLLLHFLRQDQPAAEAWADRLYQLATEEGYVYFVAWARLYRGWAQGLSGDAEAGLAEMRAALEAYRLTGSALAIPQFYQMMAELQFRAGHPGEALATLAAALALAGENQERANEADLHRLMGEIHLAQGVTAGGEASLQCALQVAQSRQARMLELRAAISLAGLQCHTGRRAEARAMLGPLYDWFQEGHDTPELRGARELLEPLTG